MNPLISATPIVSSQNLCLTLKQRFSSKSVLAVQQKIVMVAFAELVMELGGLDYIVPFQKFSPSFRLYCSISNVRSVFQIMPFRFKSPVRLLDNNVPFQKSSFFQIIPFRFKCPVRLLDYTVPFQMSSPPFRLYCSVSEVQFVFQIVPFHTNTPNLVFTIYQYTKRMVQFVTGWEYRLKGDREKGDQRKK